jgi:predicted GH43/DUF377 family glycosyl hydrolase
MTEELPRLKHNRELAAAYISAQGNPPCWPKVSNQIETMPLQRDKLYANGYNPTIVEQDGSIFMCYRYHAGTLASKLAAARIHPDTGSVESNWGVEAAGHSLEDPRFFKLISGQLWMSWVEAYWPIKSQGSVRYGAFKGTALAESARPEYGLNDGDHLEKNWVFFEHDGNIYFIYASHPKQVVVRWSGKLEQEHVTPGPRWPYGEIKGGTPPVPYEGKLLRFFHSTLETEWQPPKRAYYIGACLMNPEPPFETVSVSRKPVIYGSTDDDLTPEARKACPHYKPKVVFPGGIIQRNGYWLLSLGANDCECVIAKITPENLNL